MRSYRSVLAVVLSAALFSCGSKLELETRQAAQFASGTIVEWMDLAQLVVRSETLPPTSASRLYAYASVALYEGTIVGNPAYASLGGQLNGLAALPLPDPPPSAATPYDPATVANRACAVVIRGLAPGMYLPTSTTGPFANQAINSTEQVWNARRQQAVALDVWQRSFDHGDALGNAILAWANADGWATVNPAQNTYVPPIGTGLWIPTPPAFRRALHPDWGDMRTFVVASSVEFAPPPPPPFSTDPSSALYAEELEVYDAVTNLTPEQRDIAIFWADNPGETSTPPGHWINIVSQLCVEDDLAPEVGAEAYARVGIAMADAFITCWQAKFTYNQLRPITYIQEYFDRDWQTVVGTPPFPDYISGHSTESGAASVVLTDLFGAREFVDWTHYKRGLGVRFFSSFAGAAAEVADSRLYAGIHIRSANENGLDVGESIGQALVDRVTFRN
ncbi:MAG TPA: vanadium-dependent haloperoxidase [Planctomycetota bacterium]|nr:vanadium-dependent haloperoxidase [Planctomycetota bacterium]